MEPCIRRRSTARPGDAGKRCQRGVFYFRYRRKTGKPERTIQRDANRAKALGPDLDRVSRRRVPTDRTAVVAAILLCLIFSPG